MSLKDRKSWLKSVVDEILASGSGDEQEGDEEEGEEEEGEGDEDAEGTCSACARAVCDRGSPSARHATT